MKIDVLDQTRGTCQATWRHIRHSRAPCPPLGRKIFPTHQRWARGPGLHCRNFYLRKKKVATWCSSDIWWSWAANGRSGSERVRESRPTRRDHWSLVWSYCFQHWWFEAHASKSKRIWTEIPCGWHFIIICLKSSWEMSLWSVLGQAQDLWS